MSGEMTGMEVVGNRDKTWEFGWTEGFEEIWTRYPSWIKGLIAVADKNSKKNIVKMIEIDIFDL